MYLTDYHSHTRCSMDSQALLMDEAAQALEMGLSELCTTDHCDLISEDAQRVYDLDWSPILEQYEEARSAYEGRLKLRLGLELGSINTDPGSARKILAGAPLDFVVGSVHNLSMDQGGTDLYYLDYSTQQTCYTVLDNYFASLEQTAKLPDCYDVLGHIIYPLRYMEKVQGDPITLERYWEQIKAILTAAIQADRGIEFNTYCGRTLEPWLPVLKLYRSCGGEIVTIGSDAHSAVSIGKGVREAQELLKTAGFRYQAIYHHRTPQFMKL